MVPLAAIVAALLTGTLQAAEPRATRNADPFAYTRIYTDPDGQSRFSSEDMAFTLREFSPALPPVAMAAANQARSVAVLSAPPGGVADWHPVPRRQLNVVLAGEVEIEVSGGATRRFGPGSYILAEDTSGRGHVTRVVGDGSVYFLVVALE